MNSCGFRPPVLDRGLYEGCRETKVPDSEVPVGPDVVYEVVKGFLDWNSKVVQAHNGAEGKPVVAVGVVILQYDFRRFSLGMTHRAWKPG
jgi:hypothetical protein